MVRNGFRITTLTLLAALLPAFQGPAEDYSIPGEHPRLFLNARRARLLRRERERRAPRWRQLELLVAGKARLPEQGFALALYSQVTQDAAHCKAAVDAIAASADVRQTAIVYDWCHPQARPLEARLRAALSAKPAKLDLRTASTRALAAVALGDANEVRSIVQWWRGAFAPGLKSGAAVVERRDLLSLLELLHAVRDSVNIDLREEARRTFLELPAYQLMSYYPSPWPAAENEYRIPIFDGRGEPDLAEAVRARVADMAMVAYEPNAVETQPLQGWVMDERFTMRGALGAPYEFLWANPYQPGLGHHHLPLKYHDPVSGRLFLRSTWDDDAIWFGYFQRRMQLFSEGKVTNLNMELRSAPVEIGDSAVMAGKSPMRIPADARIRTFYLTGLKPRQKYLIEIDNREMHEAESDAGGVLVIAPDGAAFRFAEYEPPTS